MDDLIQWLKDLVPQLVSLLNALVAFIEKLFS